MPIPGVGGVEPLEFDLVFGISFTRPPRFVEELFLLKDKEKYTLRWNKLSIALLNLRET